MSSDVQDWVKFLNFTQGRDKVNRLVQYSCRLIIWYATTKDAVGTSSSSTLARIKSLEAAVSLSRKLFRIGTSVDLASKAVLAASGGTTSDPAVRVLSTLSAGGKAGWLVLDHFIWAGKIRLIDIDISNLTNWSARLWLIGCISAALLDAYRLLAVIDEIRHLSGDKTAAHRRCSVIRMELLRDSCDIMIPLTLLNKVNPGVGWFAAVISSLVAFQLEWRRIKGI